LIKLFVKGLMKIRLSLLSQPENYIKTERFFGHRSPLPLVLDIDPLSLRERVRVRAG